MMKAVILRGPGGVDQLDYREVDIPQIKEGEVLVRVRAISINPVDTKVREGKGVYAALKAASPVILGWDISGTVEQSASDTFRIGDDVFGMVNFPGHGRAYAEYVSAPANQLSLKPANLNFEQAAAATLVVLTAWQALVTHANVQPGQKVLVHAAAGGVGHIAVQLAKNLGAYVTGTSSAPNKDFVLGLGTDEHIDYKTYDWQAASPNYDFVLDTVGGQNVENSIAVAKKGGTVISIPTGLVDEAQEIARKNEVNAFFMLVKSSGEDMAEIARLLENRILKPHISHRFNFSQIREAHIQVETGRTVGKVVIIL